MDESGSKEEIGWQVFDDQGEDFERKAVNVGLLFHLNLSNGKGKKRMEKRGDSGEMVGGSRRKIAGNCSNSSVCYLRV